MTNQYDIFADYNHKFEDSLELLLTTSSVMTTDIQYYEDFSSLEDAQKFCQQREISCLPSNKGLMAWFADKKTKKNVSTFREDDFLFSKDFTHAIMKDPENPQFIERDGKIVGIVHFSDYNKLPVFTYFYYLLSLIERLCRKNLPKNVIITDNKPKDDKKHYPDLFTTELYQVLEKSVIPVSKKQIKALYNFRNAIMHSKPFIRNKTKIDEYNLIFSPKKFKELLEHRNLCLRLLDYLENPPITEYVKKIIKKQKQQVDDKYINQLKLIEQWINGNYLKMSVVVAATYDAMKQYPEDMKSILNELDPEKYEQYLAGRYDPHPEFFIIRYEKNDEVDC